MTFVLYASTGLLIALACIAWLVYANAIVHGYRVYGHVLLAVTYVTLISFVATVALQNDSAFLQGCMVLANIIGWLSFSHLIGRFMHGPIGIDYYRNKRREKKRR